MARKLVVAALVLSIGSMAMAIGLPMGHVRIKLEDFTSLYVNGEALPAGSLPSEAWVGAELRTIFQATSAGAAGPGGGVEASTAWYPSANEQLSGTLTGIQVSQVLSQTVDMDFDDVPDILLAKIAYTPIAGSMPTDMDSPGDPIPAGGGKVTMYVDTSPDYTNSHGPDAWLDSGYDTDPNGTRLDYPDAGVYNLDGGGNPVLDPNVQLFMAGTLADMSAYTTEAPGTVMTALITYTLENGVPVNASGFSEAYINSVRTDQQTFGPYSDVMEFTMESGGLVKEDWAGQQPGWTNDLSALYGDAYILSNLTWGGDYAGWMFISQDPVEYFRTPEPGTMALVGLGILGLIRRRRNKA